MKPEQAKALREPFPPELIGKLPKAGLMLDYVGHAATTDRLLQVDPEWTWEPMALGSGGEPLIVDGGLWIRLTVCGVTRPGWGDGKNIKEMIGDAIRNAAMRFGVALDLWAKQDLHEKAQEPEGQSSSFQAPSPRADDDPSKPSPAQFRKLNATLNEFADKYPPAEGQRTWKEDAQAWTYEKFGVHSTTELTKAQMSELIDHLVKAGEEQALPV